MWNIIGWAGILLGGYLDGWQRADEEGWDAEKRRRCCIPQDKLWFWTKRLTPEFSVPVAYNTPCAPRGRSTTAYMSKLRPPIAAPTSTGNGDIGGR